MNLDDMVEREIATKMQIEIEFAADDGGMRALGPPAEPRGML
jgi:hypothetical protein